MAPAVSKAAPSLLCGGLCGCVLCCAVLVSWAPLMTAVDTIREQQQGAGGVQTGRQSQPGMWLRPPIGTCRFAAACGTAFWVAVCHACVFHCRPCPCGRARHLRLVLLRCVCRTQQYCRSHVCVQWRQLIHNAWLDLYTDTQTGTNAMEATGITEGVEVEIGMCRFPMHGCVLAVGLCVCVSCVYAPGHTEPASV